MTETERLEARVAELEKKLGVSTPTQPPARQGITQSIRVAVTLWDQELAPDNGGILPVCTKTSNCSVPVKRDWGGMRPGIGTTPPLAGNAQGELRRMTYYGKRGSQCGTIYTLVCGRCGQFKDYIIPNGLCTQTPRTLDNGDRVIYI